MKHRIDEGTPLSDTRRILRDVEMQTHNRSLGADAYERSLSGDVEEDRGREYGMCVMRANTRAALNTISDVD